MVYDDVIISNGENTIWPSVFSKLNQSQLNLLNENKIEVEYKAGEIIRKQGAPLTHIISINSGFAKLYLEGNDGKNIILRLIKSGDVIGGPGIYFDSRHHYSIKSLTTLKATYFKLATLLRLVEKNYDFNRAFNRELSKNTLITFERLINLTQKQMVSRMASMLIYLSKDVHDNSRFTNVLSKEDMSELSGISKDNVTRILKDFQLNNLVKINGNVIELLKIQALHLIGEKGVNKF